SRAPPLTDTPPPGASTSTLKASSIRATWRLFGPTTARSSASFRGMNSLSRAKHGHSKIVALGPAASRIGQPSRQAVLLAADDLDRNDPADQMIRVVDVNRLQIGRPADGLAAVAARLFEQ